MASYMAGPPPTEAAMNMAAVSAAREAAAIHAQYHPQEAMLAGVTPDGMPYGAMQDPRDYFAAQGPAYFPPPQAPRLTAAAARASHFAAMYYDPTLHPQHAYSNAQAPWAAPAFAEYAPAGVPEYIPGYSVQHQDLEQQLIRQNQLSRVGRPPHQQQQGRSRHPSYDPHAAIGNGVDFNAQSTYVPAPHAPAHDQQWAAWKAWNRQSQPHGDAGFRGHRSSASIAAPQASMRNEYVSPPRSDPYFAQSSHSIDFSANAHGAYDPRGQGWRQDAPRPVWNPAQWNKQLHSQAQRPFAPPQQHNPSIDAQGAWQAHNAPMQPRPMVDDAMWQDGYVPSNSSKRLGPIGPNVNDGGWGGPMHAPYVPQGGMRDQVEEYHPTQQHLQQQEQYHNQPYQPNDAPQWPQPDVQPAQQAQHKPPAAPAPPSPGTIDKSAVPLHAVGAEIVWTAATAMLDPILLKLFKHRSVCGPRTVGRLSDESSPSTSPDMASSPIWPAQRSAALSSSVFSVDALKNDRMEDSSASSSEPSTPPPSSAFLGQQRGKPFNRANSAHTSLSPGEGRVSNPPPFYRSASQDRSREAVVGIADLLSSQWRWSTNDDKLQSLGVRNGQRSAPASRHASPTSRHFPRDENTGAVVGMPISGTDPSPAFRRFVKQVLAQTLVSPTAFMLALLYSLHVLELAVEDHGMWGVSLSQEAVEIFAQPPSAAPFKLFTLGLMIANKHLDDNTFLNKTWNEVTGIALPELNRMERWYLEKCSYEITVPEATWIQFLERLRVRTETRLSMARGVPSARQLPLAVLPSAHRSTGHLETLGRLQHDEKSHAAIMRPYRSGSGSGLTPSGSAPGSTTGVTEDVLQRFLSDTEEALQALGQLPPFDLAGLNTW